VIIGVQSGIVVTKTESVVSDKLAVWQIRICINTCLWAGPGLVENGQASYVLRGHFCGMDVIWDNSGTFVDGSDEGAAYIGVSIRVHDTFFFDPAQDVQDIQSHIVCLGNEFRHLEVSSVESVVHRFPEN
jgi:hypothetical protein